MSPASLISLQAAFTVFLLIFVQLSEVYLFALSKDEKDVLASEWH